MIEFIGAVFVGLLVGGFVIAEDAKERLTGRKPVDEFWRKCGMK